jgi:hypothetical protein
MLHAKRSTDELPVLSTAGARCAKTGEIRMNIGRKSTHTFVALALLPVLSSACQQGAGIEPPSTSQAVSTKGAAGQMPAFYDGQLFTVNMTELPAGAEAALIPHNGSINQIFASNDLDEEQDFIPVLDAIQGDGFNPLWQQNLIVFNPGFTAHQFFSDTEVLAAAEGPNPEITIDQTDEVYRCAVVGSKK